MYPKGGEHKGNTSGDNSTGVPAPDMVAALAVETVQVMALAMVMAKVREW